MDYDQSPSVTGADICASDFLHLDAYAYYLAQLCQHNPVRASVDIVAQDGCLLLPATSLISPVNLQRLASYRLCEPLAQLVIIERPMTNADFLQHLVNIIRQTEFFQSLEERKYPLDSLYPVSEMLESFAAVQQRLTVMAAQMNDLFQRTLSVALWSIFIAQEMRLPVEQTQKIFWAAITHDFGMMHIAPELLAKEDEFTVGDWQRVYGHVEMSRCILAAIPDFPNDIIAAVYEHHERCNGTGYPHAKVESEISLAGQVLALADTIVGIYYNRCKPFGRRWRDVIPVLALNREAYLYRGCEIVSAMILRSEMPLADVVNGCGVSAFAEKMLQHNKQLQQWFAVLSETLTAVGYTHGDRKLHSLQNVVLHIATTFKGSLLFKDDLREHLDAIAATQGVGVSKIVEDAILRQQEMAFHLQRLTRMMQVYVSSGECKNEKIHARLTDAFTKIGGYLPPMGVE